MLDKIAPGSRIVVKVVKQPRSAAAAKTLVKLLSKDDQAKADNERLRKARARGLSHHQRGGRQWYVYVPKQHPVKAKPGQAGTITATVDVLTELRSVARYIEVAKA